MADGMLQIVIDTPNFYRARDAIALANGGKTYRGMFRDLISGVLKTSEVYAKSITHKESGELARAITWKYDSHRMKGSVYVGSGAAWHSSRGVIRVPAIYGIYEHARGGSHAFMKRTFEERTKQFGFLELRMAVQRLPWP